MESSDQLFLCNAGHSSGRLCFLCIRLRNLDPSLEAERLDLLSTINESHDRITRCLPLEIISSIFKKYVEIELHEYPSITSFLNSEMTAAPFYLGAVCRTWRNIAWSLPQLWQSFAIDVSITPSENTPELTLQWLQLADGRPLSVHFYQSDGDAYEDFDKEERGHISATIGVVNTFSSTWKIVDLELPYGLLCTIRGSDLEDRSSILQQLRLFDTDETGETAEFFRSNPGHFPTHLSVQGMRLRESGVSLAYVTYLEYWGKGDEGECLQIFQQGLNLEVLHLDEPEVHSLNSYSVITRPTLRFLSLVRETAPIEAPTETQTILDFLILPSLEVLRYPHGNAPISSLITFMENSSCPLRILQLGDCSIKAKELINILQMMPTMETFEIFIREQNIAVDLFQHLLKPDRSFLPNFKVLQLDFLEALPFDVIPDILNPRQSSSVQDAESENPYAHRCQHIYGTMTLADPANTSTENHIDPSTLVQHFAELSRSSITISVHHDDAEDRFCNTLSLAFVRDL